MGHNHDHSHHHAPQSFNMAFALAVFLNLAFTLIEAVYAIMANSMSLLADAGHNFGDVLGLVLAWVASWLMTKAATERYSYGYKRMSIIAAIANALILVGTSAIIAYESILKLINPQPVNEMVVIIIAAIGILINGSTAMMFIRGSKDDLNIKGAFLHLAADAIISLGVVIAGTIILYTGWMPLDPIVGLLIVVTILVGTWGLLRDSINLIMDAVPHGLETKRVEAYLMQLPGVTAVHDLHIWGLSTKEIAMTAHLLAPDHSFSNKVYEKINDELKAKFNIDHITLQVEQDAEHPCPQEGTC